MKIRPLTIRLVALTAAAIVIAPVPAQADDPITYVALGDSFAAGAGVADPDPAVPLCWRSAHNYPSRVAAETGATFIDSTCSNAETKHLTTAQWPLGAPAQLTTVPADADVVTITIGGNDGGIFTNAIAACAASAVFTFGFGSPCKATFGNSFENTVQNTTFPAVKAALAAIIARAPEAEVAIVGYPWLLPATKGCFPVMPIAAGDVPYLRSLQTRLNAVIEQAAEDTGATYVDMATVSEGHDACQGTNRWVEPIVTGTQPIPVHPNAAGQAAMAEQVLATLDLN